MSIDIYHPLGIGAVALLFLFAGCGNPSENKAPTTPTPRIELPPEANQIKRLGKSDWWTFRLEKNCFLTSDQGHEGFLAQTSCQQATSEENASPIEIGWKVHHL